MAGRAGASFVLRHAGAGGSPWRRARMLAPLIASHGKVAGAFEGTHCQLAGQVAVGLGLGTGVRDALLHVFERWDGKGRPDGLRGEQVALPARIVQLAGVGSTRRPGSPAAAAAPSSIPRWWIACAASPGGCCPGSRRPPAGMS